MKYVFLDTNIYLHFQDFEQIPWNEVIGHDEFAIVVPDRVMAEIDKVKDGQPGKAKDRARKVSGKFAEYLLHDRKNGKFELISAEDPDTDFLNAHKLDRTRNDHIIIGAILNFGHISDSVAISHDNGFLMTAKRHGVPFMAMPEAYMLAPEKTDAEKERDRYKRELEALRNRMPSLSVVFANGASELVIPAARSFDIDKAVALKIAEIKNEHPHARRRHAGTTQHSAPNQPVKLEELMGFDFGELNRRIKESISCFDPLMFVSDERIEDYNRELDEYYVRYEKYLRLRMRKTWLDSIMHELRFKIANTGNAMSGEVAVELKFPENIKLYNARCKKNEEINQPPLPDINIPNMSLNTFPRYGYGLPTVEVWNPDKYLSKTTYNFRKRNIIHGTRAEITFDNGLYIGIGQPMEFSIRWLIADSASADRFSGELKVRITQEQ